LLGGFLGRESNRERALPVAEEASGRGVIGGCKPPERLLDRMDGGGMSGRTHGTFCLVDSSVGVERVLCARSETAQNPAAEHCIAEQATPLASAKE